MTEQPRSLAGQVTAGATQSRGRGSILLGIVVAYATFAVAALLFMYAFTSDELAGPLSALAAILPAALLVSGVVLTLVSRTRRAGVGVLIGVASAMVIVGGWLVFQVVANNS